MKIRVLSRKSDLAIIQAREFSDYLQLKYPFIEIEFDIVCWLLSLWVVSIIFDAKKVLFKALFYILLEIPQQTEYYKILQDISLLAFLKKSEYLAILLQFPG